MYDLNENRVKRRESLNLMATEDVPPVSKRPELARVLGPLATLSVIVGSVIGSGIFIVPARVALNIPSIGGIVSVWIIGGIFSLAGALALAELAAMLPQAGGPYVYLREAYGKLPAFLFGWTEFLVIRSGSVATLAAACAYNITQLIPLDAAANQFPVLNGLPPQLWESGWAIVALVVVATINVLGTGLGGKVQIAGTIVKVGTLGAMIVLPFVLGKTDVSRLSPILPESFGGKDFLNFMVALVGVLWAYDGWVNSSELAEEITDPGKTIPRSLIQGMSVLIAAYLGTTLVYHLVLTMPEVAATANANPIVAAVFWERLIGPRGLTVASLAVMFSILIALNGNALSGPRAYFAMARDGLFPQALCRVHPRFKTPANAIIVQVIWSITILVVGTIPRAWSVPDGLHSALRTAWNALHETALYDILYHYVIFGGTVIYTATITGVFVLRRTRPDLPRPYRTWGYPITPLLYVLSSLILMGSMLASQPTEALAGVGLILLGVPTYWWFHHRARTA
jgi:APA family basic amino acid/polyamine antiporter